MKVLIKKSRLLGRLAQEKRMQDEEKNYNKKSRMSWGGKMKSSLSQSLVFLGLEDEEEEEDYDESDQEYEEEFMDKKTAANEEELLQAKEQPQGSGQYPAVQMVDRRKPEEKSPQKIKLQKMLDKPAKLSEVPEKKTKSTSFFGGFFSGFFKEKPKEKQPEPQPEPVRRSTQDVAMLRHSVGGRNPVANSFTQKPTGSYMRHRRTNQNLYQSQYGGRNGHTSSGWDKLRASNHLIRKMEFENKPVGTDRRRPKQQIFGKRKKNLIFADEMEHSEKVIIGKAPKMQIAGSPKKRGYQKKSGVATKRKGVGMKVPSPQKGRRGGPKLNIFNNSKNGPQMNNYYNRGDSADSLSLSPQEKAPKDKKRTNNRLYMSHYG